MQKKLEPKDVYGQLDARLWAKFFVETCEEHPDTTGDFESMIGWFANAIMAGYDAGVKAAFKKK